MQRRGGWRQITMEWENSALGNLFVPDVLTPEQFYDSRRDDSNIRPVKKLMMAILEDALRCFQNNADAKGGPRKRLFSEAEHWLCGEGGEGPFSFETVCETLGIEPQFLRSGLRDWRSQQLAAVSALLPVANPSAPRAHARLTKIEAGANRAHSPHNRKAARHLIQRCRAA